MIHHCNRQAFIILVVFTVPFYHILLSRYMCLTKHHFLSDILVPYPDLRDLYSYDDTENSFFCVFNKVDLVYLYKPMQLASLLATSCLHKIFFAFFFILEELDSYIALNYFSMDFSLVTPATIRMENFLIIKAFNLQCKNKQLL